MPATIPNMKGIAAALLLFALAAASAPVAAQFGCAEQVGDFCLSQAKREFTTDFSKLAIDLAEIRSGGPPKDGIPPIDDPAFQPLSAVTELSGTEPVVGMNVNGDWKAYPLRILTWHEIVNDEIGGVPVSVTFCPLCNAVLAFDRRVGDRVLDFGTTGRLRHSDLLMYDRQTESWWQQFTGQAVIGALTGTELEILPVRLESFAEFAARAPDSARVLVPRNRAFRDYGRNPYAGYDSAPVPFLYDGETPEGIRPLARVVSLAGRQEAWTLALLRREKEIVADDGTILRWRPGQASGLDTARIEDGRDVGTVTAAKDGEDVPYFVDFAFAFHAFRPEAPIHRLEE
jgi:hypothetical protein